MTKSKKSFLKGRREGGFYHLAQKHNLRSRAYFKLDHLDKKFRLFKNRQRILDLGCAPGGWLEYLDHQGLRNTSIIGIDLLELSRTSQFSENITIIQDDFANLSSYTKEPFDVIISDMAPEFTGDSKMDRGRTHQLNLKTIEMAPKHLKNNGRLLFKTFEGEELDAVREKAKLTFKNVTEYKPQSSKKQSTEFYFLCEGLSG